MKPAHFLAGAVVILIALLYASVHSKGASDERASLYSHQADSLHSENLALAAKAEDDSIALVEMGREYLATQAGIDSLRAKSRKDAARAAVAVRESTDTLRALIAGQVEAERALDAIELGHRAELDAKDAEIAQADSATAVEKSLRLATEAALASDRRARQVGDRENAALRAQIDALKSSRRKERLTTLLLTTATAVIVFK